jgi:predicted alpha/beta hydrolase
MDIKPLNILAKDGFPLKSYLYLPDNEPIGLIVCNAGTCIRQGFYRKIAEYLVNENFLVLTYDYRGVGESRPKSLHKFLAKISDWGQLDMTGIFEWVKNEYPHLPKYLLAHSMGGQIIGLSSEIGIFDKIVSVASSYGNYHFYEPKFKKITQKRLIWMQFAEWWYGYIPAKWIGGEAWAKGISQEWREWSRYMLSFSEIMQLKVQPTYDEQIKMPFRAYFMEDDTIATLATIPYYQKDFRNTTLEIIRIYPQNQPIGHFGFYTGRVEPAIWADMIEWLKRYN